MSSDKKQCYKDAPYIHPCIPCGACTDPTSNQTLERQHLNARVMEIASSRRRLTEIKSILYDLCEQLQLLRAEEARLIRELNGENVSSDSE